jgi:hypothetical protein
VPAGSVVVLNVASCVEAFTVPVPSTVVPLLNVTVPVGLPPYAGVTVAVNVTFWPGFDGFLEETSVVLVLALPTV